MPLCRLTLRVRRRHMRRSQFLEPLSRFAVSRPQIAALLAGTSAGGLIFLLNRLLARLLESMPAAPSWVPALLSSAAVAAVACGWAYTYVAYHRRLRRYGEMVEGTPNGVVIHRGGKIRFANSAAVGLLGAASADALVGRLITELIPDETAGTAELRRLLLTPTLSEERAEQRLRRVDGTLIDAEVHASPLGADRSGDVVVIMRDISKRKAAQRLVEESEARWRRLINLLPVGIAVHAGGVLTFVNPAGLRMLGAENESEVLGRPAVDFVHPDYRKLALQRIREMFDSREAGMARWAPLAEEKFLRIDGSAFDVEVAAFPLEAGERPTALVMFQDVTERAEAHRALRQSEEYLRALLENIHEFIMVFAADGRVRYVSPSVVHALGFVPEDMATAWLALIHEDDHEKIRQFQEDLANSSEKKAEAEGIRYRYRDGTWHTVDILASNLLDNEAVRGYLITAHDVTERVRAQQKLEQHARRLELLHSIDSASVANEPVDAIARQALMALHGLIPCRQTGVTLFDLEHGEVVPLAVSGENPAVLHAAIEDIFGEPFASLAQMQPATGDRDDVQIPPISSIVRAVTDDRTRTVWMAPLNVGDRFLGALMVAGDDGEAWTEEHATIVEEVATSLAAAIQNQRLFRHLELANRQLQELSRRLVRLQEEEWRRLARELHDEVGQTLTVLSLSLQLAERNAASTGREELESIHARVTELMEMVRDMSLRLRPTMLDDLGLAPTLLWLCENFRKRTGLDIHFSQRGLDRRFDLDSETAVYRIVQEALTNATRHAETSEVTVSVWTDGESVHLQVADEGRGFDPDAAFVGGYTAGLSSMRERATLLGGHFEIDSAPGSGTIVSASIPLHPYEGQNNHANGNHRSGR
ncbi:MAG: PAS domain S-box protein [Caldilineae bacterium]|nr:MAG: PAS domain S-box protein [Caldilineae bacterium]